MYRFKSALLFVGLLAIGSSVAGAPANRERVDLDKLDDVTFAIWASGDGNQSASQVTCAVSANTNKPQPDPGDTTFPYDFKVTDLSAASDYYLYLDGNENNTGNARIAAGFRHRDILSGSGYESLSQDVYDGHDHDGQFKNCMEGNNSELEVSINATELAMAQAGRYTGSFRGQIRGGLNGTTTSSQDFQVTIDVTDMVRISSMDNIDLGSWAGGGDINATETFCVYSNNASAAYNVMITSQHQDGAANFFLVNADGSANVPYVLMFNDSAGGGTGATVGGSALSGNGTNNSVDCGGADNAMLTVKITEPDLASVPADSYSDTLTLVVSPE